MGRSLPEPTRVSILKTSLAVIINIMESKRLSGAGRFSEAESEQMTSRLPLITCPRFSFRPPILPEFRKASWKCRRARRANRNCRDPGRGRAGAIGHRKKYHRSVLRSDRCAVPAGEKANHDAHHCGHCERHSGRPVGSRFSPD
jgi:hypothetical protein